MTIKITKEEWDDYRGVQKSGAINMMFHPLIEKFMPEGNYGAALTHFEEDNKESTLIIPDK